MKQLSQTGSSSPRPAGLSGASLLLHTNQLLDTRTPGRKPKGESAQNALGFPPPSGLATTSSGRTRSHPTGGDPVEQTLPGTGWGPLAPFSTSRAAGSQALLPPHQQLGAISDTLELCQFPTRRKKKAQRRLGAGPRPRQGNPGFSVRALLHAKLSQHFPEPPSLRPTLDFSARSPTAPGLRFLHLSLRIPVPRKPPDPPNRSQPSTPGSL